VTKVVARGFIPDRLRSSRKAMQFGAAEEMRRLRPGPLCSLSGINPLTTGDLIVFIFV
jgi:hypothetical protein